MEFDDTTATPGSVETPWGTVGTTTRAALKGLDGQCTASFHIDTQMGKAAASLHVEVDRGELPTRLRLVLLCGYAAMGTTRELVERESLLTVSGAFVGWRAQTYLDPATGLPDPERPTSVMLADHAGKIVRGFTATEAKVRHEVDATLVFAAEADRGYVARVYASLMNRMMRDINDDVANAEDPIHGSEDAALKAREFRDRARALIASAEEHEGMGTGPTP